MLKELVEHNTTQSAGDMTAVAEAMARHMNPALKPILLLSHIDVVEANPEDWTPPPFEFTERDGMFYGRGVADDKDEGEVEVVAELVEVLALGTLTEGTVADGSASVPVPRYRRK